MARIRAVFKRLLMIPPSIVTAFWEKADAKGSRSTVLRPLGWLLALCSTGAVSSASLPHGPGWLTVVFAVGAGASVVTYLSRFCLLPHENARPPSNRTAFNRQTRNREGVCRR